MKNSIKLVAVLVSIALLSNNKASGQSNNDSLINIVKSTVNHDTIRIKALNQLAINSFLANNFNEAEKYELQALYKSTQISYKRGIAIANAILGGIYTQTNENQKALNHSYKSLEYYRMINDTTCMNFLTSLGNISSVYSQLGLYGKALEFQLKTLKIAENIKNNDYIINSNINLANLYRTKGDYNNAINYYNGVYKLATKINDTLSYYPNLFFGLGEIYAKSDLNISLSYFNRFLNIATFLNDSNYISDANVGIAKINITKGDYNTAIKYLNKSLSINDDERKSHIYLSLGKVFYGKGKHETSKNYFTKSLELSKKIELKSMIMNNYQYIYKVDSANGDYLGAMESHKLYISYKDSLFNTENEKKMLATQMNFNFDKEKSLINAKQEEQNKVSELNSKRQQIIIISTIILLVLVAFITVLVYRSYLQKNKANQVISHQKELVEEKQKEILDNITYAKRIQTSRLPSKSYINENAKNNFVMFQPKDIVSGDFYWATKNHNKFYLATADCTGHGVSGSMMSMLNISILNEVVNERGISSTGDVLNETRKEIIKSLNPNGNENVSDGMDCTLCAFDFENKTLEYSSANNNFYIVRNGEIINIKADKMPVGLGIRLDSFTTNTIQLESGDVVYTLSDGYCDQFGGENNKKFKAKQFEQLLSTIQNKNMSEQKEILTDTFNNWTKGYEQTDDVLVIGIKID
jgi:serine phosphatase RsbU (regulator of sigma subunit)/lipopolysaccharide biosynthesis regulator YciM